MNREDLYRKTVDVLLDAYNDGELEHGNCCACAVGNICKESGELLDIDNSEWSMLFSTDDSGKQRFNTYMTSEGQTLILGTGYSVKELARIEFAFESSIFKTPEGYLHWSTVRRKQGQFIGLCAVLDVLKEIHSIEEVEHLENVSRLTSISEKFKV